MILSFTFLSFMAVFIFFIFSISNYSWPWTTQGLGALISYTVENPHLILQSTFFIPSSVSLDSTICGCGVLWYLLDETFCSFYLPGTDSQLLLCASGSRAKCIFDFNHTHNFTFVVFLVHLIVELNNVFSIVIFNMESRCSGLE